MPGPSLIQRQVDALKDLARLAVERASRETKTDADFAKDKAVWPSASTRRPDQGIVNAVKRLHVQAIEADITKVARPWSSGFRSATDSGQDRPRPEDRPRQEAVSSSRTRPPKQRSKKPAGKLEPSTTPTSTRSTRRASRSSEGSTNRWWPWPTSRARRRHLPRQLQSYIVPNAESSRSTPRSNPTEEPDHQARPGDQPDHRALSGRLEAEDPADRQA